MWKHGDVEMWDIETWRHGDVEIWRLGCLCSRGIWMGLQKEDFISHIMLLYLIYSVIEHQKFLWKNFLRKVQAQRDSINSLRHLLHASPQWGLSQDAYSKLFQVNFTTKFGSPIK